MKTLKAILITVGLAVLVVAVFGTWYKVKFSMGEVHPYSVNDSTAAEYKILIATQSSSFKDSVVTNVIKRIKDQPVYIRVIDISSLPAIEPEDWTTVVVIHTWEIGAPPEAVKTFIDRTKGDTRIFELTTFGDGSFKLEDVDGITCASNMHQVDKYANEIVTRINFDITSGLHRNKNQ